MLRDAKKDFTVPAQENALLATAMVTQTDVLMDLEPVWTARETQQESTASNVQMASSVTLSEECPRSASPAPAPCQRLPTLQSPVTEKVEACAVSVRKIMQDPIVKGVPPVTMGTHC